MTVESIRAAVEIGNVAGDHLFVATGEMALGEMDSVGEVDDLAQEIRTAAEALDDSRHLLPAGAGTPIIVGGSGIAGRGGVLSDMDLGLGGRR